MTRRVWSAEDLAALGAAIEAGEARADVAARFGVSVKAVGLAMHRHGMTKRQARARVDWQAHAAELAALVKAGERFADIAARFGCSYSSVAMACNRAGIRVPAKVVAKRNRAASAAVSPEGRARSVRAMHANARYKRGRGVKIRAWCPAAYVEAYFALRRRHFPPAEARGIVLRQVAADEIRARKDASRGRVLPRFEDTLARVARGEVTVWDRDAATQQESAR